MGILIKNPETERKARLLASLRGQTLTGVIDQALEKELAFEREQPRRKPTLAEMREATVRFRRDSGLDQKPHKPVTKAEWDALWPTGIPEIDNL